LTDSTEALSTILAYKGEEEEAEKEEWNPPRPNPPQQRVNKLSDKKSKSRYIIFRLKVNVEIQMAISTCALPFYFCHGSNRRLMISYHLC